MEKFVSLSTGIHLEYVEQGSPDGEPVIFLHGVTDSWHSFERVLPLLPASIRAFAVSVRGHGDSSKPESGYLLSDMAADLLAFMDAMGIGKATLVGHSMGTGVAQRFAIAHPERVSALVLIGAFSSFGEKAMAEFVASSIAPLTDPISVEYVKEWQLSTLAQEMPADHFERIIDETLKVPAHVWRAAFQGFLETPDCTADLATVSIPTLLIWGDRDSYAERTAQDRLLEVIRGSRLLVYERFGHAVHWEDPARVSRDLLAFVAEQRGTVVAARA